MTLQKFTNKTLSIFFRLIIILFGIYIINYKDNYFECYWYYLAIIPYLFIYVNTVFNDGFSSKIRLVNDYLFIVFLIYGKDLDIVTATFLLLPVINSPNHSGDKKSIMLYVLFVFSIFLLNNYKFSWTFIIVTFAFRIVNFITDSRNKYFENISKLNKEIELFLEKELELRKSYKVYNGILDVLNNIKFLKFYRPTFSKIICFKIDKRKIIIENSSVFVWSYTIDDEFIQEVINAKDLEALSYSNINLEINDVNCSKNFFLVNQTKNNRYIFVFVLEDFSNRLFNTYYISLLQSITARISKVIGIENSIKNENKKMLMDFRKKYFHIQNAEKAMHFIRNRFNTLDNFIEMSKDNINGKMDGDDLKLYSTELDRLERSYKLLMDRVKAILDKSDKPFSATKLEDKTLNFLFGSIREIWLDFFETFNVEIDVDVNLIDKFTVKLNSDGLYILILDWIANLKKYSEKDEIVVFSETQTQYLISFRNQFKIEDKKDILELRDDFNSTERDKILQRTSHGILIMKSILEEMCVSGVIEVDGNIIELKLSFKKEENENSDF
ncbi:hypothetical protein GCM10008015_19170 [Flavobacterium palustre]|uniref:Histidine kinase n=1 Tax=Flavobacterium palustre TaxID=1476463 RepID=A0ABQ1HJ07_9FLAO|nr:hypothetical protein [Flavobacterium palustre]GGA78619.1 hypothetical protein GCM10008015_19170 [Flavobacterium palustre]